MFSVEGLYLPIFIAVKFWFSCWQKPRLADILFSGGENRSAKNFFKKIEVLVVDYTQRPLFLCCVKS